MKLSVLDSEKGVAIKLGALLNPKTNELVIKKGLPLHSFNRWIPLTIELVPSSSWYDNVRSLVSKSDWDFLRKTTYSIAKYRCEICGGRGGGHPVEAHEIWEYDEGKHSQKLVKIQALCPSCHKVKHIGLASINVTLMNV